MGEKKFSKREALRFGWQTMKGNLGFFIGLLIVTALVSIIPDFFGDLLRKKSPVLSFGFRLVGIILSMIVGLGLIKILLNFCDNFKSKIADLFSQYQLFFRYLFASVLVGLIASAGFILLIIPGIYLSIRLQFYDYFIVDKNAKIIESLRESWRITQGSVWNLFLFGLLLILINLLGTLLLLIGLFATIPTTMVATAFVYRKLLSQREVLMDLP